jgi:hypothetical protein
MTKTFSRLVLAFSVNFALVKAGQSCPKAGRNEMESIERPTCASIIAGFPALRTPTPAIADRGTVRLGLGCITAGFPALRAPTPEIADRGTVRLGLGCITAGFPFSR